MRSRALASSCSSVINVGLSNPPKEIDMNNDKDKDKVNKEEFNGDEVNLKTVELRLTSVREAIQRSRYVFLVMTIASSAILFTLWNDRFSRDKDLAFTTPSYETTEIKEEVPAPLNVYGRQQLVAYQSWAVSL